jgi:hypothetical protein
MKLKFRACYGSPDRYEFDGETIKAFSGEAFEEIDLSDFLVGEKFEGIEPEVLDLVPQRILYSVERDEQGELHLVISQSPAILGGHWKESDWIDASDYDPEVSYIQHFYEGEWQVIPNIKQIYEERAAKEAADRAAREAADAQERLEAEQERLRERDNG